VFFFLFKNYFIFHKSVLHAAKKAPNGLYPWRVDFLIPIFQMGQLRLRKVKALIGMAGSSLLTPTSTPCREEQTGTHFAVLTVPEAH
jgi:hypothetical protein